MHSNIALSVANIYFAMMFQEGKMKKYIIDQFLFLAVGITIISLIPLFCGPVFTLIWELVAILIWGYLCRRILLLPIDLILGKVTRTVYFATQSSIEDLEFFKNMHCCEWKFNLENGETIRLLVLTVIKQQEVDKLVFPPKNVKLKITYFRLSKILLEWNQD